MENSAMDSRGQLRFLVIFGWYGTTNSRSGAATLLPNSNPLRHILATIIAMVSIAIMGMPALFAQEVTIIHCGGLCPQYNSDLTARRANIVVHHVFAAGLSNNTGLADWVAYRLTKDAVGVASLLPRSWQPDRLLEFSDAAEPIDANSSVYSLADVASTGNPYYGGGEVPAQKAERARLAPITSFANTPYWSDLNNLSNMVPMPNPLRLGAWLALEQTLNTLVQAEEELFVVSGPLYLITEPLSTLGATTMEIKPAAYYKVVVADAGVAAFVFPEDLPQHAGFCAHKTNLHDIERMSELTFFPERDLLDSPRVLALLGCQ